MSVKYRNRMYHCVLQPAKKCDQVGDVHCINCDNVSEVLKQYVTLCIATEVKATELVMCTVLIVMMSVRYCDSM